MKLPLLFCACTLLLSCVRADNLAAISAAEQARADALRRGDASALAGLLANELRYTHSNGRVETKDAILAGIRDRSVVYERLATFDHHVLRATADVVVLSGRIDQRKVTNGRAAEARLLFHSVWRKEDNTWRLLSIQTAQPPAPAN